MALQGDLQSFALPDVLRLLAGTSKTGRLGVTGAERSGDVWLHNGQIVGGAVTSSPFAHDAADVVFELLRFESGSFAFEDDDQPSDPAEPTDVESAIGRAEELVREWDEVESVVPSIDSWVSFVTEIEGESTTISAEHWRTLAIIGSGMSVRDLGDRFEQTDLGASRRVKTLVEAGLVELGEAPEGPAPSVAPAEPAVAEYDDLSVLRADDGPVVLETREDALLPEPLPGAGTSFEGDLADMTSVDGRRFESDDASGYDAGEGETRFDTEYTPSDSGASADPGGYGATESSFATDEFPPYSPEPFSAQEPAAPETPSEPHYDPFASFGPDPAAEAEVAAEPAPAPAFDDPFGDGGSFGNDDFFGDAAGNAQEEVGDDPLASTPSSDAAAGAAVEGDDSDRGELLNFLSTVKP